MSDYRGHLWGGVVFFVGLAATVVALSAKMGSPVWAEVFRGWKVSVLLGIALLMALWPDVDIDSKGQRLFYRIFLAADVVCSVPSTKCPVSAAVSASRIVSMSRNSPTRMMSGSSRNAERNASLNPWVSRWTSR